MLRSISLNNFRGFRYLELSDLAQITLLTGKNGTGKSSILEGIFTLFGYDFPDTFEKIRNLRGLPPALEIGKLWEPLFYNMNTSIPMTLTGESEEKTIHLTYKKDNDFSYMNHAQNVRNTFISFSNQSNPSYALKFEMNTEGSHKSGHLFLNSEKRLAMERDDDSIEDMPFIKDNIFYIKYANAHAIDDAELTGWFGDLEISGKQDLVLDALKIIDPSITDIKTIVQNRYAQLYIKKKNATMPVKLSGDGLCKLIYLVLAILKNQNSIILVDEIENGLHYSMQKSFWKIIAETANKCNSQIIATTHSYECIQSADSGIAEADMSDRYCLYRIEQNGEDTHAVYYSPELLSEAVESFMEVR